MGAFLNFLRFTLAVLDGNECFPELFMIYASCFGVEVGAFLNFLRFTLAVLGLKCVLS